MKLLLRREQQKGMLGRGITFYLDARAELTPEETENIKKYRLGETVLYEQKTMVDRGSGLLGVASRFTHRMLNISVTVDDLTKGKRIDCKDIVEMLAVEDQIKEAAQTFKNVLYAAAHFGGEDVIELP
ncbi:MAG: hypothetical protein WDZ84_01450 [Rhodovibrionaceae bacterium]